MTTEQFMKTMTRRPFVPFAICMADGNRISVRNPEHISISQSGRTVAVFHDDACDLIDLTLVNRLDVEAPQQAREEA